jgi:hypothetical protein
MATSLSERIFSPKYEMSPIKRTRKNKDHPSRSQGIRARNAGRTINPVVGSDEFRIYRVREVEDDNTKWVRYDATCNQTSTMTRKKKELDSFVHRFGREIGFKHGDSEEIPHDDTRLHNAEALSNRITYNPESTVDRVRAQSYFECYVLKMHPNTEYSAFLRRCLECSELDRRVFPIKVPSPQLLLSYITHLRDDADSLAENGEEGIQGRMNKGSTIDLQLKYISGTLIEFGEAALKRDVRINEAIKQWKNEDDIYRAKTFLFEDALPKLWDKVWMMNNLSFPKRVSLWTRLLCQIAVLGRSSNVTTKHCPTMKDLSFPVAEHQRFDDGIPAFFEILWHTWKSCPKKYKKAPHSIRVHANPLDLHFSPVHWLITDWSLRANSEEICVTMILFFVHLAWLAIGNS